MNKPNPALTIVELGLLALVVVLLARLVAQNSRHSSAEAMGAKAQFNTEYQAVLLNNGLAYYGKIEKMGSRYVEMSDVHYVQSGVEQKTKKQTNVLLKRGKELHGPDRMIINADHVVFIEPVDPNSKLAALRAELKQSR
jgi:hypothetical protein